MDKVNNIEQLFSFNNRGIHNFSLGVLDSYFYLWEKIYKGEVFQHEFRILYIQHKTRGKTFVFETNNKDITLLKELQCLSTIYSIDKIPFLENESKFKEVGYNLSEVFNPVSYLNAKKRHQRISYPLTWLKNHNLQVEKISVENFREVEKLHQEWVLFKMNQPNTYRIMFPTGRYLRCCRRCIFNQEIETKQRYELVKLEQNPISYTGYLFKIEGKIVAVRVFYLNTKKQEGYDLAFFGNIWDTPSQISNYINVWILKALYDDGIRTFNCGASLNQNLKTFKTHLPSKIIESYAYSKIKKGEKNENN